MIPRLTTVPDAPTVWFTGLSGAGKTTIARAVATQLDEAGLANVVLDGDELRATISADLGFSREERAEQVRRTGHFARILGDAGVIPLVALISPFRADRDRVRALHSPGRFLEVHVATPLEVCVARDVKGLYRRAAAGEIGGMSGLDQGYEEPIDAEVTLLADGSSPIAALATTVRRFALSRRQGAHNVNQ